MRAGERLRVVGFARRRAGTAYRPASGDVRLTAIARGRTIASGQARLDAAGAFSAELALPADAPAGDAAVLAAAAGATGGAAIHIDGVAGDLVLAIAADCGAQCPADAAFPVSVTAKRADGAALAGRDVRVRVVRSPHLAPPGGPPDAGGWATTQIEDVRVRTDAAGVARLTIPGPTDGLASTYGIVATSGASTASAQVTTPTARVALAIVPERTQLDIGEPAAFDVRGFDAVDGRPAAGLAVRLRLEHGPTIQEQQVTLGSDGQAHAVFRNVVPGTNLALAQASVDGHTALDANAVTVAPQALLGGQSHRSVEAQITTDKSRYRVGERVHVDASLSGATGDAFVDLEGARAMGEQSVPAPGGRAAATFTMPQTVGDAAVGVAFVRDGALEYATQHVAIDGAGHDRTTALTADKTAYAPGSVAHLTIADGDDRAHATLAIRLGDERASGGASFEDARGAARRHRNDDAGPDLRRSVVARLGGADAVDRRRSRGERARRGLGRARRRGIGTRAAVADRPRRHGELRPHGAAESRTLRRLGAESLRRRRRRRGDPRDRGEVMASQQIALEMQAPPNGARLMLLDTYGLVYRAFFALPALTTTRGVPINAAYGFTMMLNKLIADEKPTHVIAAFDKGLPAARIALYDQYKAQRTETPDELRSQFALVRKILATYDIPIVEIDGEEADDVIATLAQQAELAQQQVLVVTGDLDLLQIVDERTTVLTTRRGITELGRYDEEAVRARFDLSPRQLPGLSRAQGRSVRQPPRDPRRRREDGDQAGEVAPARSTRCSPIRRWPGRRSSRTSYASTANRRACAATSR